MYFLMMLYPIVLAAVILYAYVNQIEPPVAELPAKGCNVFKGCNLVKHVFKKR